MAITLDNIQEQELYDSLRIGDMPDERRAARRLFTAACALVNKHAPDAPEPILQEACFRLVAYWFDMPNAHLGAGFANAFRNSGAQAILAPYRVLKARLTP